MKGLAIALIELALADAASEHADLRASARTFLFSKSAPATNLREHWLRQAGLTLDALGRLEDLSQQELLQRLRNANLGQMARQVAPSEMMVRKKGLEPPRELILTRT